METSGKIIETLEPKFTTGLFCTPVGNKIKIEVFANFFRKEIDGKVTYMPNPEVIIYETQVNLPKGTFGVVIKASDVDS